MKTKKLLLVSTIAALAAYCAWTAFRPAAPSQSELSYCRIEIGMPIEEAKRILGRGAMKHPSSPVMSTNHGRFRPVVAGDEFYSGHEGKICVGVRDGKICDQVFLGSTIQRDR